MTNIFDKEIYKLPEGTIDREFSFFIDEKIGFNIKEIETKLALRNLSKKQHYTIGQSRSWIGLSAQIFQTPYNELYDILTILEGKKLETAVDLGAAYGRLAFVFNAFYPDANFYGYEFVTERVQEGNRLLTQYNIKNSILIEQDLIKTSFDVKKADLYFIYDFSDPGDLRKMLEIFSKRWGNEKFLIVARGKSLRSIIQNKFPEFHLCYAPFHTENWSVYSSYCDLASC